MALNPFKRWREKKAENTEETKASEVKEEPKESSAEEEDLPFFTKEEEKTVPSMDPVEEKRASADYYETLVSKDSEKKETVSTTSKEETGKYIRRSWESVSEIEGKIDEMTPDKKRATKPRSEVNKKVEDVISRLDIRKKK